MSPAVRLAVGLGAAAEAVPLDHTGEATSLGRADHVHPIAWLQEADVDPHPDLDPVQAVGRDLAQLLQARRLRRALLDVARFRLVELPGLVEAELDRHVAILLHRAELRHPARTRLDERGGGDLAPLVE